MEAHWRVAGRPSRIVVDLDRIAANVRYFRATVTSGTEIMAVVKADGYGHGAVVTAIAALQAGATQLAVATVDEGIALRDSAITAPVLVLGPIEASELPKAITNRLTLTISDPSFVDRVAEACQVHAPDLVVPVHVKIDTGMRRFGALPQAVLSIFGRLAGAHQMTVTGMYSHFADADGADDRFTREQAALFDACVRDVRDAGHATGRLHLSNSAAALRWREFDYDMVRVGISLYGLSPSPGFDMPEGLAPALRLQSRLARVTTLAPGESVSYGRTYVAQSEERIGLVPIGYADGYRRGLSNRGVMTVDGAMAIVRGRVCMDQTVIGLPASTDARIGSIVDVVSIKPGQVNSVASIARQLDTIDYEVVTGLSRRLPRIYTRGSRVVAVQDLRSVSRLDDN